MINPVITRRLTLLGAATVLLGGALYLLNVVGEQGIWGVANVMVWALPVVWIIFAGTRWWMLMPVAVAFGGAFVMEHKLFTHEIALPLSVMALLPLLATRRQGAYDRERIPLAVWVLLGVFVFNLVRSILISEWAGMGGGGSIFRAYFHGLWAVLFFVVFYRYGSTRYLKGLLLVLFATYLLRARTGVISFYMGERARIPGLNFVMGGGGIWDLRLTGIQLVLFSFAFFHFATSRWIKILTLATVGLSVWLVLIGGGRASLGMICVIPVAWAIIRRRFGWFAVACCVLALMVVILNQRSDLIYRLPDRAQRTVSILVGESSTKWLDWHVDLRASNEWHKRLSELGVERWTESVSTFLTGNRIEPYRDLFEAYSVTIEDRAQIAARMGLYESGLWTVMTPLGLVGFLSYAVVLWVLLRGPVRVLVEEGVCELPHIFYFLAVVELVLWVTFCWISGGYPSHELMMAGIAKAVYEDRRQSGREEVS